MSYRSVAHVVASCFFACAWFSESRGQTVLATSYGNPDEVYGCSVAVGPDLDGDGIPDVAVGASGTGSKRGRVRILSGIDLHILNAVFGGSDQFGWAVSWCGDLDGDGIPELAVGAPGAQQVHIFSPANWKEIRTLSGSGGAFGWALQDAGDVNRDGFDDLVVGNPGTLTGAAICFSGADGSILFQINGSGNDVRPGASLASIGDVNGDGIPDLAVGDPNYSTTIYSECSGAVDLFSGADGTFLWKTIGSYYAYQDAYLVWHYDGDFLGAHVTRAGDFDGDGIPDVVGGQLSEGYNDILSGADGSILFQFLGAERGLKAIGDNDGDGRFDIAFAFNGGFLSAISGRDGSTLWVTPGAPFATMIAFAPIDDVNGDGRADLVVGDAGDLTNGLNSGVVKLITIDDLWLNRNSRMLFGGTWVQMSVRKGPPGNLSAIAVTAVNGAPLFLLAGFATFDATGTSLPISAIAPTGLSGTIVDLRAFGIDASGRLVHSRDEEFTFQ